MEGPDHAHTFTTAETLLSIKSPFQCVYPPTPSTACFTPPGLRQASPTTKNGSYTLPKIRPSSPLSGHFDLETAAFIPCQDADVTSIGTRTDAEAAIGGSTTEAPRLAFDFDSLPVRTLTPKPGPAVLQAAWGSGIKGLLASVLAPLTHIESPVVSRAQQDVVIRSA
ncbi:hypothetical protein FRC07_005867, partial [Ceratobasidium sp. 392]